MQEQGRRRTSSNIEKRTRMGRMETSQRGRQDKVLDEHDETSRNSGSERLGGDPETD